MRGWGLVGVVLLAASGVAWVANAARLGDGRETANCGAIAAGYIALAWVALRAPRLVPWALGAAAVAGSVWLLVFPFPPLDDIGLWLWALGVAGLLVAALAARRGSAGVARAGFVANAAVALYPVMRSDVASPNGWTLGNVLALAGFVALAFDGLAREPEITG